MVGRGRGCAERGCAFLGATLLVLTLPGCGVVHGSSAGAVASSGAVSGLGVVQFPVQKRKPAPALAGMTLAGQQVSLADLGAGKVVFVNVWASWCGPCREESPMLATSAKLLSSRGVAFLGLDEDYNASAGRTFVASTGSTYPQLADKSGSLLRKVGVLPQSGIPSTVVIDRHARIAAVIIGAATAGEITGLVDQLTAES
jgi:thiol-disulfide isomerase/thioredoxin